MSGWGKDVYVEGDRQLVAELFRVYLHFYKSDIKNSNIVCDKKVYMRYGLVTLHLSVVIQ